MLKNIKEDFPELYTKKGKLTRIKPNKYVCSEGHEFNKTRTFAVDGVTFGRIICTKCNRKGQRRPAYGVWNRLISGQIEVEEFILKLVARRKCVQKEQLHNELEEHFGPDFNQSALGHLVYFGYLEVDHTLKGDQNIVRYSINRGKIVDKRYEYIW